MAEKKRKNVPEHLRRAIRLAISVAIAAATGFSLLRPLGGWHSRWGSQTMMGTKWAAITSVVCNAPVIGKTTEVALERVLGTVTGGLLGYGLAIANDELPFLDQPYFTVLATAGVAFLSIILGYNLKLDYSGRLFIMTFILVVMAAPKTTDAFVVAVTRISGIIFGVINTMIMSVIIFPKSASHQATDNLQAGLAALAQLNSISWNRSGGCRAAQETLVAPQPPRLHRHDSDQDSIHLLVDDDNSPGSDECCDEALTEVYSRMTATQEFTGMSKSETYVLTSRGRWCLIPAFKCFPWRSALPDREIGQVVGAARKVARLLWCLHTSLPEATDAAVLGRYHGAARFLQNLGDSLQVYLEQLAACFPNQRGLDAGELYAFVEGVETLLAASQKASHESTILLRAGWSPGAPRIGKARPMTAPGSFDSPDGVLLAHSAPDTLGGQHSTAYICDASGLVTRVSGSGLGAANSARALDVPGANHRETPEGFSPISEVLPEGSQTEEVLRAAAEAAESDSGSPRPGGLTSPASKQQYLSQVRWQATQFLLRRLARELLTLNSAFLRLSALLPPTRWESRRRKAELKAATLGVQEPLLNGHAP